MKITINIDDRLMAEAWKASGGRTKNEIVEQGLRLLVQRNRQQAIRRLRGHIKWEGNLDAMRSK